MIYDFVTFLKVWLILSAIAGVVWIIVGLHLERNAQRTSRTLNGLAAPNRTAADP